ncbi:hypothetical protein Q6D67_07390 [Haliea sp. E1-2-M8]|uniref:hypothetical protein n=1 Tax=Haliea sp. E1-2-M8 TaxID=3064706 RepID=UPI002716B7AE|nr:hypothetical protein [Haliea sp. E1-2-M8]MDO8861522.1 hypothetical protein [Haliea sp. E1-2-M8]
MGDILDFPSQRAQGMAWLDRELRKLLASRGADQALIDFAATQLSNIYSELGDSEQQSISVTLPPGLTDAEREQLYRDIDEGLANMRRENHALLVRLMARLVLTELKLFQRERG